MTRAERERAYRALSLARALDERMWRLARAGRAHFAVPCSGHEAIGAGYALGDARGHRLALAALSRSDRAAGAGDGPARRDAAFLFAPVGSQRRGRQPYAHFGSRRLHVLSLQGPQPNHCSHGVGCAWGSKLLGDGSASVIAFGDAGRRKARCTSR